MWDGLSEPIIITNHKARKDTRVDTFRGDVVSIRIAIEYPCGTWWALVDSNH
ncbi:MAG: hypothetical protein AABZ43_06465 [Planctomycetota bacterium]